MAQAIPRILHVFSAFDADPAPMRCVRVINALGGAFDHAIACDDSQRRGAAPHLAKKPRVTWPKFPPLEGRPLPGRLLKLAASMQGYDLICTYGYGAIDAAMAHTLFADVHELAPLVHHELDLDTDEAAASRRRAWYRRFALGRSAALVIATRAVEAIALGAWDQPRARVRLIPDGIDTRAYSAVPKRDLLPGLIKRRDEAWLGTFGALHSGAALVSLVTAIAGLPPEWQLVIVGETTQRKALEAAATRLEVEDRIHFAGSVDPSPANKAMRSGLFGLLDMVALVGDQLGGSGGEDARVAIEAMAAGLPVIVSRTSEAAGPLASDNGPLLAEPGSEEDLAARLRQLAASPAQRKRIGLANRAKAREEFDELRMIERTSALYRGLTGRASPPG